MHTSILQVRPDFRVLLHRCLAAVILFQCNALFAQLPPSAMPRPSDFTTTWWRDGFPSSLSPAARWHRCVQTGSYGFVLDTEAMQFPHFGPTQSEMTAANEPTTNVFALAPANLGLQIEVEGKAYRCQSGGKWSKHSGPRLIESGRFVQRADVTDLVFANDTGERLNVEARFETVAWPDRLGMILSVRPGIEPIATGEASFGRVGGGFGLDGSNHLEVPHREDLDTERFTVELWAFVPVDYQASDKTPPWLFCKNRNEATEGNFGIMISNGLPQARLNIGGGASNAFTVTAAHRDALKLDRWNHLAISYDGSVLRLFVNGQSEGQESIGRMRVPGNQPFALGRRQDNFGDGYHFRGVIDEVAYHDRALSDDEIRNRFQNPAVASMVNHKVPSWNFRENGIAALTRPRSQWKSAKLKMELRSAGKAIRETAEVVPSNPSEPSNWHEVSLAVDPVAFQSMPRTNDLSVQAREASTGVSLPIQYDSVRAWHRINLDSVKPVLPDKAAKVIRDDPNNAMERIRFELSNPTNREQTARLLFEKSSAGFHHHFGSSVTGISAIIRDTHGNPTGIPLQLSKNWHVDATAGEYNGLWLHGFTQMRLPAKSKIALELSIVYGHWGGVASASHAQLCLIGWGSNQLWDQSALGAWGESICYEPDQVQGNCTITDVRPLMVFSPTKGARWNWTPNVGGGDFFRLFDKANVRVPHSAMTTTYHRQGPCLTEVTYAGWLGDEIKHSITVSLARTDDLVRATYRIRMDVKKPTNFSRFVIFQIGADTYSYTGERKFAIGDESGLRKEWGTNWGGNVYRTDPLECSGRIPWVSLHDAEARHNNAGSDENGAWANRGMVIRQWNAKIGGIEASPWVAEHGVNAGGRETSTMDIVPPPEVRQLLPGDFVEATIEHLVVPQFAGDYYGPNKALHQALQEHQNTWRMIDREAIGNDRDAEVMIGTVVRLYPDVCIDCVNDEAKWILTGGLGYLPITLSGLSSSVGYELLVDGVVVDQSVHGNDFWQTDYDSSTRRWSQTFNLPAGQERSQLIHFRKRTQ